MKFLNLLFVVFLFYNFECSSSSSCGELHNISNPYYLPGTICKWKAYELQCDGNDTVLYIGATKYLVKEKSVENKTLRLVDPDLAIGSCRPKQTLSWPIQPYFYDWWSKGHIIYFFNCTEEVKDSMYKLTDCMDGPDSRVYALIQPVEYYYDAGIMPNSCKYAGQTVADAEVYKRWNDSDGTDMMQMLRRGFVVRWNITDLSVSTEWDIFTSSDAGDDNYRCSVLQHCWSYTKREE